MNIFTSILNLCFPPRAGMKTLAEFSPKDMSQLYDPNIFQNCTYLAHYGERVVKTAVTEYKFHANQRARTLLQALLTQWLEAQSNAKLYFIPMPLSRARYRARGFNQAEQLLSGVIPQNQIITRGLHRVIDTAPQSSLPRQKRLKNLDAAFACKPQQLTALTDCTVILFDDVITTGTTMAAARKELRAHLPAGTKLICLAVAH